MNILIITPGFPENELDTDCIPTMQNYLRELSLQYQDVKFSVISIHYPYRRGVYNWNSFRVFACGGRNSPQPLRLFYWVKAIFHSLKINKDDRIDIIHSFWLNESSFVGYILNRLIGAKHITTLMGQDAFNDSKFLKFLTHKKISIIAVSEFQANVFQNASHGNINRIINWGVEKIENGNYPRDYDIIGVGSLIPLKNYELFIEIIYELCKNFPDLKCLLVGDGILRTSLENLINKLELNNNISLTGQLKREDVINKMKNSKILLHTSRYESFGFVIAEALACGCYVVSSRTGCAYPDSKIYIAGDKAEYVKSIISIMNGDKNYDALRPYKLEETVSGYYKLYKDIFSEM